MTSSHFSSLPLESNHYSQNPATSICLPPLPTITTGWTLDFVHQQPVPVELPSNIAGAVFEQIARLCGVLPHDVVYRAMRDAPIFDYRQRAIAVVQELAMLTEDSTHREAYTRRAARMQSCAQVPTCVYLDPNHPATLGLNWCNKFGCLCCDSRKEQRRARQIERGVRALRKTGATVYGWPLTLPHEDNEPLAPLYDEWCEVWGCFVHDDHAFRDNVRAYVRSVHIENRHRPHERARTLGWNVHAHVLFTLKPKASEMQARSLARLQKAWPRCVQRVTKGRRVAMPLEITEFDYHGNAEQSIQDASHYLVHACLTAKHAGTYSWWNLPPNLREEFLTSIRGAKLFSRSKFFRGTTKGTDRAWKSGGARWTQYRVTFHRWQMLCCNVVAGTATKTQAKVVAAVAARVLAALILNGLRHLAGPTEAALTALLPRRSSLSQ